MYTLHADEGPNPYLNIQTHATPITNTNPSSSSSILGDDRGTFVFTPTFIGEYKVSILDFMKPQREFEQ